MVADLDMAFSPLLPELVSRPQRIVESENFTEDDELWRTELHKLRRRQDDMMTVTMIAVVVLCLLNTAHVIFATRKR